MGHILFTWELGGGAGHISGFLPVARQLKEQGHSVQLIVNDVVTAEWLLAGEDIDYMQAPLYLQSSHKSVASSSYSGILLNRGFADEKSLLARVKAWLTLYRLTKPDLILHDFSPTALLASRALSIQTALYGAGFFTPPLMLPLPNFRPWMPVKTQQLLATDARVLSVVNNVLVTLEQPPLTALKDLFDVEENFLCTLNELDHYPERPGAVYWGPRFDSMQGVIPQWLPTEGKKIFVYVHSFYPHLEKLLRDIHACGYSCLIYSPGISNALVRKYRSDVIDFSDKPLQLQAVVKECQLIICNAGLGIVSASLLAGIPMLLLPIHVEQLIVAKRAAAEKAALYEMPENKKNNFKKQIKLLMENNSFTTAARAFATRYHHFNMADMQKQVVARCEEMMPKP
ncbi:MAG: glycosyltransferase family 1 protein [Gammaproteobacteria bacterium]|nr:glycosyltransferase family 1 protein [Gammaproteobacteria bacterium]